jgi:nicotinamide-nucleotide amidase
MNQRMPRETFAVPEVKPDQEIYGLAQQVGKRLRERKKTVAVAESCTGGLLGAAFTDVPGSSDYFIGGVIAYDNRVKVEQLGVPASVLEREGAVSAETAAAMASGAKRLLGTDIALSITGVAGPDEEEQKPAGLTFIGLAAAESTTERHQWQGDRWSNRRQSVVAALSMLNRTLVGAREGRG